MKELGKVAGVGAVEDETVVLYCARVTQRYVEKGEVRFQRQAGTVGYGNLDGDPAGYPRVDGEVALRCGVRGESGEGGAGDGEGDGRSAVDGDGEAENAPAGFLPGEIFPHRMTRAGFGADFPGRAG